MYRGKRHTRPIGFAKIRTVGRGRKHTKWLVHRRILRKTVWRNNSDYIRQKCKKVSKPPTVVIYISSNLKFTLLSTIFLINNFNTQGGLNLTRVRTLLLVFKIKIYKPQLGNNDFLFLSFTIKFVKLLVSKNNLHFA